MLFEAQQFAAELGRKPWDFAVELSNLRNLGLTNSDCRWLLGKGLAEHVHDITLAGEHERTFQRGGRLMFVRQTCFVLTEQVAQLAALVQATEPVETNYPHVIETVEDLHRIVHGRRVEKVRPKWDRDRQELRLESRVVKQFKVPASNQETILAAFEEEGWPPRIDDPLPPQGDQDPKRRLQETIKSLNRNQKDSLIRFFGDGSGQGVRWEPC